MVWQSDKGLGDCTTPLALPAGFLNPNINLVHQDGGLGQLHYPLVSDLKREISEAWGVLSEEGVALRGLFVIDKEGIVQVRGGRQGDVEGR